MIGRAGRIELSEEVETALQERARATNRTVEDVAGELVGEAVKMQRCPGIVFADGPTGRRARVEGTGIEVFAVIRELRASQGDEDRLRAAFHWLSEAQLQAALAYAQAHPTEIDRHVDGDEREEEIIRAFWTKFPASKPAWR